MKIVILCSVLLGATAGIAHAEGLSFGADLAIGQWSNSDGGSDIDSNGGINGEDDRFTGKLGLSAANDFGMFVGQIDLNYQHLARASASLDDDDATMEMLDVTLRGMAGWRRAFGDVTPQSTLAFATGNAFTIAGVPIARDAAVVEAGLDLNLSPDARLGLSYNGQFGSGIQDNGFKANLSVRF